MKSEHIVVRSRSLDFRFLFDEWDDTFEHGQHVACPNGNDWGPLKKKKEQELTGGGRGIKRKRETVHDAKHSLMRMF